MPHYELLREWNQGFRTLLRTADSFRVRRLGHLALLLLCAVFVLHGCGGYDPLDAGELRIFDVGTELAARGIRVFWTTTDPATSRIDYGPTESAVRTFYQTERNGIGLDADGHVMSETRTNDTTTGPIVNSVLDNDLVVRHSLIATETTTTAVTYLAITSQNRAGQISSVTVTLPRPNPLIGGHREF